MCIRDRGVDEDYTALENELAQTVANIESTHPGYDEYRYSVDEIGHNPVSYTHLDVYKRQGLAVWGVINLLEGYGSDNPAAKSQGIKQLMAGGGVVLIGLQLIPLLSGLFS